MSIKSLRLFNDTGSSSTDNITSIDTLTGIGDAGAVITFTINSVAIGSTKADASGNYTFTPSGLADGTYTVTASEPGSSKSLSFTLDTATPLAVTEQLVADTGISSTDNITSNPALTGSGTAGDVVTLTEGGKVLGTTTVGKNGTWSFAPTSLTQRAHTIVASQADVAGNVGPATTLTFTLDSVAPSVTENLLIDTGASSTDKITSNPALMGTAQANSVVTLKEGSTVLGTTTTDASGNWTFTPTALKQSTHTITASETDIAGNTGTASLSFTLDSVAPVVTERLASDTGVSSTDKITSNPALTGSGDPKAVITLTVDGTPGFTTTANGSGMWTFVPANLSQGIHTIVASETDAAGNTGTATLTFTLDSVAPSVTEALLIDTGASATDNITSNPTLTGTAEENAVVTLRAGTTVLGTATADASGNWTFVPTALSQGAHTITASETDVAGNTGTASLSFTLDSVAPAVTEVLADDTGTPGDGITYDPTLTGTADPGGQVVLTEGTATIGSVTADATGAWTFTPTNLTQGTHTIVATDTDVAGNTGSAPLTFTLQYGRTISSSISGPVDLMNPPADNPLLITSTGAVNAKGAGVDGIDGTNITPWNITNDGTVSSLGGHGILLAGAGTVSNGPTSGTAASISGSTVGVQINGAGTVSNWGSISGTADGVALEAGGSVTNAAGATISASGSVGAGVFIAGAPGTVTNDGLITGPANIGVLLAAGGTVTNAASASILGGQAGVFTTNAAATVTNDGTISATAANGCGVYLKAGGTIINDATGSIYGQQFGAFTEYFSGYITNYGKISAAINDGVILGKGGSVTNALGGSIVGVSGGVYAKYRAAGTLTNSGSIAATGAGSAAVFFDDGGTVTNNSTGSINGAAFGVFITGAAGTVTNSGYITDGQYSAVKLGAGGSITNTSGGSIVGGTSGVYVQAGGSVTNSGSISATGAGADFEDGGSLANQTGGTVSGGDFGVFITGAAGTVTNSGTITGAHGVGLQAGGSVANYAGATISGTAAGVFAHGGPGTINNAGSISASASGSAALDIEGGGNITNAATGSITGASFGVFVTGGAGTVDNAGSITGTNNVGVDLSGGGTVTNAAGASISASGFGVAVYGSGGTVINAGTISGSISAVHFGAGTTNNLLVVDPGAVFNGNVVGGGGANTLELAQGAVAGSLGGIGSTFIGFGTLTVDSGADWTLTGNNTAGTVLNNGTLAIASNGSLDVTTTIDPTSAGQFQLGNNSVIDIAAAIGSATRITFLGAAEAIIDTASQFGANVGQSTYSGPLFENFGLGDKIDLKDVSSASLTLDYTSSTGLLQIASGGVNLASLMFQTSSLASGTFLASDDGSGHALIGIA
jgi:hypothetical protein